MSIAKIYLQLMQWDVSLDPIKFKIYGLQLFWGGDNSSVEMAAVVVAIEHEHMLRFKEQGILTNRAVFANHLPRTWYYK